jgi:hypothetical protein
MYERCEECGKKATYVDHAKCAPELSGGHHDFRYRDIFLCDYHASFRKMTVGNTCRIEPIATPEGP